VVLYGCGFWALTLKEEHRLKVFDSRVLRRIYGPRSGDVMGGWRKLHNLYSSPSTISVMKSRRMRWTGQVERMGRKGMQIENMEDGENRNERDY
jgi:hypothetical protein